MNKCPKTLVGIYVLFGVFPTQAWGVQPAFTQAETAQPISNAQRSSSSQNHSTPHTPAGVGMQQWELSEGEWQRFESLMQGIRGSLSTTTISPIEVLGIHARDDEERRLYAQRWVTMMYEDTVRIVAFQQAVHTARQRHQSAPPPPGEIGNVQPQDHLLLFVRPDCSKCSTVLQRLIRLLTAGRFAGLDIFLLDVSGDDQAVRDWAATEHVDGSLVRNRAITLNHDNGTMTRIATGFALVPLVMKNHGDRLVQVRMEGF